MFSLSTAIGSVSQSRRECGNRSGVFRLQFCIAIILLVSVFDTALAVWFKDFILVLEQNWVCRWLIEIEPEFMSLFVFAKLAGNFGVVSILLWLKQIRYSHTGIVAMSVASFQLFLVFYLTLSDPRSGLFYPGAWSFWENVAF